MNRSQKITLAAGIVLIALVNMAIPSGGLSIASTIVLVALGVLIFLIYIESLFWVYQDARSRKKSPLAVTVVAALFFWPMGLLLWFFFRPEKPRKMRRRRRKHLESHFTISKEYSFSEHEEK